MAENKMTFEAALARLEEIVRAMESGSAALDTVYEALDLPFDEEDEDCDTLGGLVFSKLSVIPQDGSRPAVEVPGMLIQVEEIVDHRVEWAKVTRLELPAEEAEEEE